MKKIVFFISIFVLTSISYAQNTIKSSYKLTKLKYDPEKFQEGYASIYLIDSNGKRIQKIDVFKETYENDGIVEEVKTSLFKNVYKIVKVRIDHCACYCDTDTYTWFLTKKNKWVSLPVVEEGDYELELKTKNYIFAKNKISLVEYQDEYIKTKKIYKRKSEKVLKEYFWDGKKLFNN